MIVTCAICGITRASQGGTPAHECPPKWLIYVEDYQTPEDASAVYAYSVAGAVQAWGDRSHGDHDYFSNIDVLISGDNGQTWVPYNIYVESCPIFVPTKTKPKDTNP